MQTITHFITENFPAILRPTTSKFITTGFSTFDELCGGFQLGELIVIGGRPGMGKSQMLIQFCKNIVEQHSVAFFTLDNNPQQWLTALLACHTQLARNRITANKLSTDEKMDLADAAHQISQQNLQVNTTTNFDIDSLITQIQNVINQHQTKVIFIDNLHINKTQAYKPLHDKTKDDLSTQLAQLAAQNNCCIVVSCNIGRSVEARGGCKVPQLCDLLHATALEANAHKVLLLYRPEYYGININENNKSTAGHTQLHIVKNKSGICNHFIMLYADKNFTGFSVKQEYK